MDTIHKSLGIQTEEISNTSGNFIPNNSKSFLSFLSKISNINKMKILPYRNRLIYNQKFSLKDEDDTRNNENFQKFMDKLLNKENSVDELKKREQTKNNLTLSTNKIFFMNKFRHKSKNELISAKLNLKKNLCSDSNTKVLKNIYIRNKMLTKEYLNSASHRQKSGFGLTEDSSITKNDIKEFDGKMLNRLIKLEYFTNSNDTKTKKFINRQKNNFSLPKIIVNSKTCDVKGKNLDRKIRIMKKNAINFLRNHNKHFITDNYEQNNNSNSNMKKKIFNHNNEDFISNLKYFENFYKKNITKQILYLKSKKKFFSDLRNHNDYINDIIKDFKKS